MDAGAAGHTHDAIKAGGEIGSPGPPVLVDATGAVTQLTFNRPASANAINLALAVAFRDEVTKLVSSKECRVLVIAGTSTFFSAGGDIQEMRSAVSPAAYLRELVHTVHETVLALANSDLLVIAAVEGTAAGAGVAIVAGADLVIASQHARFLAAYADAGLTPDTGLSALLPTVVGPRRANEMLLMGRHLDAVTALEWGLVNQVVAVGEAQARARDVAGKLAGGAFPALSQTRRLLHAGRTADFVDHLADEAATILSAIQSQAAQQRLATFGNRAKSEASAEQHLKPQP